MRNRFLAPVSIDLVFLLVLTGCGPQGQLPVGEAAPDFGGASSSSGPSYEDCPVTEAPDPAFVPPHPWPAVPPGEDQFWVGTAGLWTALPRSGSWRQLALGDKFWMWSELYSDKDVHEDGEPDLVVSARQLDGNGAPFHTTYATNGYHPSFNQAMLTGVTLSEPGCWEFTAEFKGNRLSFVIWVPSE